MLRNKIVLGAGVILTSCSLVQTPAKAEPLQDLLVGFLENHKQIKAAKMDVQAAHQTSLATKGGWYPSLQVTAHYGNEQQMKPNDTDDSNMMTREWDMTVTQRLYDFGATNATIRTAELTQAQTEAALVSTRSALLLRAISAYQNLLRANEALNFAKQSEDNIKKQTELENALVERGAGFSTDVLQAKVQLAGAQARRVRAEGALQVAKNGFRGVFGKEPGDMNRMEKPVLPVSLLPASVEEAVEMSLKNNPLLAASHIAGRIAQEAIASTKASSFYPSFDAIADYKMKRDVGSTAGNQREVVGKVQMSFPFNLGFTAINTLRASEHTSSATDLRFGDSKDQIEEQTRNAWEQLKTAKSNAELLVNQANIAAEFLEDARKERALGRRSLLEVLNGETALINASSDAASAETDVAIAVFTLLDAMGELDESVLATN